MAIPRTAMPMAPQWSIDPCAAQAVDKAAPYQADAVCDADPADYSENILVTDVPWIRQWLPKFDGARHGRPLHCLAASEAMMGVNAPTWRDAWVWLAERTPFSRGDRVRKNARGYTTPDRATQQSARAQLDDALLHGFPVLAGVSARHFGNDINHHVVIVGKRTIEGRLAYQFNDPGILNGQPRYFFVDKDTGKLFRPGTHRMGTRHTAGSDYDVVALKFSPHYRSLEQSLVPVDVAPTWIAGALHWFSRFFA